MDPTQPPTGPEGDARPADASATPPPAEPLTGQPAPAPLPGDPATDPFATRPPVYPVAQPPYPTQGTPQGGTPPYPGAMPPPYPGGPAPAYPGWVAPAPAPRRRRRLVGVVAVVAVVLVIALVGTGIVLLNKDRGHVLFSTTTGAQQSCSLPNTTTTISTNDKFYIVAVLKDRLAKGDQLEIQVTKNSDAPIKLGQQAFDKDVDCYIEQSSVGPFQAGTYKFEFTHAGTLEAEGTLTVTP